MICYTIEHPAINTKLFGNYLHAITIHAPVQYQIVSLSSVNAENQERLFSQAKRISLRATNRRVENVLPTILLSIQARQKMTGHKPLAAKQNTIVTSVACKVLPYKGTAISKEFIAQRLPSWQAHLERLSTFLKYGENIWWTQNDTTYLFYELLPSGPALLHFRATKLPDVEQKAWKEIVNQRTVLPTPLKRLFNENGDFMGTRKFGDTGKVPENTSRHFPELTEEEYTAIFTQPQVEVPTESTSQPCIQHENRTETNILILTLR